MNQQARHPRVSQARLFSAIVHILALLLLYAVASAAVMDRFMAQNGGLHHKRGLSFDQYLRQQVERPYAYRVLLPLVIGAVEPAVTSRLSDAQKDKFTTGTPLRDYMKAQPEEPVDLETSVRYHLGYFASFFSLIGLAFALRALTRAVRPGEAALANLAPVAVILLLPLSFLHGGYLYDFPELLFLAMAFWAIVEQRLAVLCCILPLAILNKESNILIPLFYAVYSWKDVPMPALIKRAGILTLVSAASFLLGRYLAPDTGGTTVMDNLDRNLAFLANPESWFLWFRAYGGLLSFPRGYNLILVGLVLALVLSRWPHMSPGIKRVLIVALAINFYLVLAHGYRDEMRNWSLSFIPLYLALVGYSASRSAEKPVET